MPTKTQVNMNETMPSSLSSPSSSSSPSARLKASTPSSSLRLSHHVADKIRKPITKRWLHYGLRLTSVMIIVLSFVQSSKGNPDAKRLYDDLISRYNKLVRPVMNVSEPLTVHIKLKLSQLIEVNLKNQIMTTNLWVEQYWYDYKLTWDPREYGGVDMLHVPSDHIWRPDIVLYNTADGNFEVTLATKAILNSNGFIQWKPPAIYKSSCEIDVEYFPFDEQTCVMKFGSWTYDGYKVDLRHRDEVSNTNIIDIGIDLSEFYLSVEWDLLEVPAIRNEKYYTCCVEPYIDITFNISMRRKTLFYTVNLIIPCMGISFLTVLVFYLPSDSGEKVSLSISIFISLTVFFLLLVEIIPPTSLVVPLLGKYLLFTMILVSLSIAVTVVVLNVHFRSSATHVMSPWVRRVFIHMLPRLLMVRRPCYKPKSATVGSSGHGPTMATIKVVHSSVNSSIVDITAIDGYHRDIIPPPAHLANGPLVMCNHRSHRTKVTCGPENGGHKECACQTSLSGSEFELDANNMADGNPGHYHATCHGAEGPCHHHKVHFCPEFLSAMEKVNIIAENIKENNADVDFREDWKYVAMVLDRLFLWIFSGAVLVGTCAIILHAPTLYDNREAVDIKYSQVAFSYDSVGHKTRN